MEYEVTFDSFIVTKDDSISIDHGGGTVIAATVEPLSTTTIGFKIGYNENPKLYVDAGDPAREFSAGYFAGDRPVRIKAGNIKIKFNSPPNAVMDGALVILVRAIPINC